MSIHINTDDNSDYAVATMTNIEIDYEGMANTMSKIEKPSGKFRPELLSKFKSHVRHIGLIRSARSAFSKQISKDYVYELEWMLYSYFAKQLRDSKYEAMLNKEKMFRIPVLDLRRVNKMSEDDLAILNYFGYFELRRHEDDGVTLNGYNSNSGKVYFITIEQKFDEKYIPLRAALYHEYAYYLQIKSGNVEHVSWGSNFSTRIKHHAEWYACGKLYSSGRFADIHKLINGHMRKFYDTKDKEELFRATLIERMLKRREMKLEVEEDDWL